jgi:uncharacterized protein
MGQPVVHFEIIGPEPERLRDFYGELFGWEFDTDSPVSAAVSEPTDYGFVQRSTTEDGTGIPGGVGGGPGYESRVIFYIYVDDVGAALQDAERLGGTTVLGSDRSPSGLVIGHFTDPQGNRVGVAGPN